MEYKIISEDRKEFFNTEIEHMVNDGWEPCGELQVNQSAVVPAHQRPHWRNQFSLLMSRETEITGDG